MPGRGSDCRSGRSVVHGGGARVGVKSPERNLAGRQGAKVLLAERFGRLGGMAVRAMVGPLMGHVESRWVDQIVERFGGRKVDYEFADLKYAAMLEEVGVDILLHAAVAEPLRDANRVAGARLLTKQGFIEIPVRTVIDATGDGDVAWAAGAEFEQGRGAGPTWSADGLVHPTPSFPRRSSASTFTILTASARPRASRGILLWARTRSVALTIFPTDASCREASKVCSPPAAASAAATRPWPPIECR